MACDGAGVWGIKVWGGHAESRRHLIWRQQVDGISELAGDGLTQTSRASSQS